LGAALASLARHAPVNVSMCIIMGGAGPDTANTNSIVFLEMAARA
jgi:hypothetical protein